MGICEGRVVVVTGAGRGIGRAHALLFAQEGAKVVVNDLGGSGGGTGSSDGPAHDVVDEIKELGGEAVANVDDVADWAGAQRLIATAVDTFGRLDVLVNNAGILRDKMLVNMDEADWDAVIRVNLKGMFAPTRFAAGYWRERAKAGEENDARIINTTSASGLFGNPGQTNYGAAKAGIAGFTITAAQELTRYGVTVNALAPGALTRLTAAVGYGGDSPEEAERLAPENVSPIVVWLGSPASRGITGRVFRASGSRISIAEGWSHGPFADKGKRWYPAELDEVIPDLVAKAAPPAQLMG